MEFFDLRSDTVSQPTPAMREAMARADVGDDVYEEDETVNLLQKMAAERMGMEAGLFVPSGTMGNLVALLAHCGRGDEAIMGDQGHTFVYEAGGLSALGGIMPHTLPNQPDGSLKLEDIRAAIRSEDVHFPISRLVILENTQNRCGGTPLSADYTCQVAELAHKRGLKLHIDGARIFNAAVAQGVPAAALVRCADSVTFCLSKGLCAPVGSVLCGSEEFIYKARRARKSLGGGMRQAGILAAAGIVALESMVDRLAEDHRRARLLAQGLAQIPGIQPEMIEPPTNIVFARLDENHPLTSKEVAARLLEHKVKLGTAGSHRFRLVTHFWIDDQAIEHVLKAFRSVL
jgi:threonine aldolase